MVFTLNWELSSVFCNYILCIFLFFLNICWFYWYFYSLLFNYKTRQCTRQHKNMFSYKSNKKRKKSKRENIYSKIFRHLTKKKARYLKLQFFSWRLFYYANMFMFKEKKINNIRIFFRRRNRSLIYIFQLQLDFCRSNFNKPFPRK